MSFNGPPKVPQERTASSLESHDVASFQGKLLELMDSGIPLRDLAQILGAEKYLTQEGAKGKEGLRFKVREFVQDQFESGSSNLRLPDNLVNLEETILPSGEGQIVQGSGKGLEGKEMIPRTHTFISLLSELKEPYSIVSGTNTESMMREETYRIFLIPNREKLLFINDEEGNATFVVHQATPETWRQYVALTKDQLKGLPASKVETIVYPGSLEEWKIRMESAMHTETPEEKERRVRREKEGTSEMGPAPEGWYANYPLSKELAVTHHTVQKTAETFREAHPEWFQKFLNKSGWVSEYYHPELVALLRERLQSREEAPEGWSTRGALTTELNADRETIERIANSFKEARPEWFGTFSKKGALLPHYHPALVSQIRHIIESRPSKAPEGWRSVTEIVESSHVARETVLRIAGPYRKTHPEWFGEYLNKAHGVSEYMHPDLVKVVASELEAGLEVAPEGWITASGFIQENVGVSRETVMKLAESFRKSHPEWFSYSLVKNRSQSAEHYHPELIKEIKKLLESREEAPGGWRTERELSVSLDAAPQTIHKLAEPYRKSNSEWFQRYSNKRGVTTEYYHPELIQEIRKVLVSRPEIAPEGWYTNKSLMKVLNASQRSINLLAEKHRSTNPEWYKEFRTGNGQVWEHYHPALIQKISEELAARPEAAPEGWYTKRNISDELGKDYRAIEKLLSQFRNSNPEWFGTFLHKGGRATEHYHPDLMSRIRKLS